MFNYRHPSPRREWSGVGSCGSWPSLRPLAAVGAVGAEFREVIFCAQARYLRAICSELDVHCWPKSAQAPLGSPRCPKWFHGVPREPKGSQSDAKESPLGAQGAPKAPKRQPKVTPRKAKWAPTTPQGDQQITKLYTHKQNTCKLPIHRHTAAD